MLSKLRNILIGGIISLPMLLTGCAATQATSPEASRVLVSPNPPPKGCKYVGDVVGNQGNFFTGGFTSNKNLEQGSINDMRNQAAAKGGNYIQMLANRAGVTGNNGGQQQTNVVYTGNAYFCPNLTST